MLATFDTCSHHAPASPSVYGGFEISRYGTAPRCASRVRYARTSARYCVFVELHGVTRSAPKSSFSAITGVWQTVEATARAQDLAGAACAASSVNGFDGWPTRVGNLRSK